MVRLQKVLEFENGRCVEIPINKDGSIKWMEEKVKQQISKISKQNREQCNSE